MGLSDYKKKRDFKKTPEPGPTKRDSKSGRMFVIQKHRASHLHYDFRLESDGVLKSWAVPKGPSLDPTVKRLAMQVEDHPVDYAGFEGIIPEGEYGGGTVMVWDEGTYTPDTTQSVSSSIHRGELKFTLKGKKLNGSWALVRTNGRQWLLIKHKDAAARKIDVSTKEPFSVKSGRTLEEIAEDEGGNIQKAKTGDPAAAKRRKRSVHRRAAGSSASVWNSNRTEKSSKRAAKKNLKADTEKPILPESAVKAPMPTEIKPMLATLVDKPFDDNDWLFETKWDGVRAVTFIRNGRHHIVSRNLRDMTAQYPELTDLNSAVDADTAILDGEIVALDSNGKPTFQLLQPRFGRKRGLGSSEELTIAYFVFDLLYWNGYDLTRCSLTERKTLLEQILRDDASVKYSQHIEGKGIKFFAAIEKMKLEGMIAKRADSRYIQKRTSDWLKIKTVARQEVVIGGYTEPRKSRTHLGALVVGLYDGKKLRYVGHTGGGFNRKSLADVYARLQPLKTVKSPFDVVPKTNEAVQWVKPELVCEVKFSEWTSERIMRHPIFLGLREDKDPEQCKVEIEHRTRKELEIANKQSDAKGAGSGKKEAVVSFEKIKGALKGNRKVKIGRSILQLTNLDKIYWPADGLTKGDLVRYYYEMAKLILPYYKDRPLILKRYPNGINEQPFHQHSLSDPPPFVQTFSVGKEDEDVLYGIARNPETLVYIANLGSISLHPWASHTSKPHYPDWMIFDVDPGSASFDTVCDVALEVKDVLDHLGLEGFPKTSGSKGIHVYVPIKPDYSYEQVVPFANLVAAVIAKKRPDIVTIERMVAKRKKGRVYLDYLQNGYGKSVAGPYSVRARDGATVSAPLEWIEVKKKKIRPQDFTIKTIFKRLDSKGDLFRPLLKKHQSLARPTQKLETLLGGLD